MICFMTNEKLTEEANIITSYTIHKEEALQFLRNTRTIFPPVYSRTAGEPGGTKSINHYNVRRHK
jgi:hypothetical protein